MHQVLETYRRIALAAHRVETKLIINDVEYTRADIVSFSKQLTMFKDESPSVGNTPSGTISMEVLRKPGITIPTMSRIQVYSRIVSETEQSEWIPKGVYFVDTRKTNLTDSGEQTTLEITGYDAMMIAEQDFTSASAEARPAADIVNDICDQIGVTLAAPIGLNVSISDAGSYTCRELLGYIGGMLGGNFIIDDAGQLRLIPLGGAAQEVIIIPSRIAVGDALAPIGQVIMHKMDGNTFTAGPGGRVLNIDSPWATQEAANYAYSVTQGFVYRPFSAEEAVYDARIEIGDDAFYGRIYEESAEYFDALVASVGAPPENEIAHNFPYQSGAMGGGGGSAKQAKREAEKKILEEHQSIIAALDGDDGAPEDLSAGFQSYVRYDLENNTGFATSELFSEVGNKALAKVWTEAYVDKSGSHSLAGMEADVIKLKGRVDVTGIIVVEGDGFSTDGNITAAKGRVFTKDLTVTSGTITMGGSSEGVSPATLAVNGDNITISGTTYGKKEITFAYDPKTKKEIADFDALGI